MSLLGDGDLDRDGAGLVTLLAGLATLPAAEAGLYTGPVMAPTLEGADGDGGIIRVPAMPTGDGLVAAVTVTAGDVYSCCGGGADCCCAAG